MKAFSIDVPVCSYMDIFDDIDFDMVFNQEGKSDMFKFKNSLHLSLYFSYAYSYIKDKSDLYSIQFFDTLSAVMFHNKSNHSECEYIGMYQLNLNNLLDTLDVAYLNSLSEFYKSLPSRFKVDMLDSKLLRMFADQQKRHGSSFSFVRYFQMQEPKRVLFKKSRIISQCGLIYRCLDNSNVDISKFSLIQKEHV